MSFNSNRSSGGRGSGILKSAGCPGQSPRRPTTHSLGRFWGTPRWAALRMPHVALYCIASSSCTLACHQAPPSIGGHAVTLLHEEGNGSATFDGAEDLIEQGSPMVLAAQLLAAPGPRLTGGPGHVDVQRVARQVLGTDVAVEALRAVVDKAENCSRPPDARGPGLSGSQASQEGAIQSAGCHIHAAEVSGEG